MQLPDLSDLRAPDELIEIPLNGQVYQAVAEPAAEVVLGAMSAGTNAELAEALQSAGADASGSLDQLATLNPVLAMRLATAGLSQTERSVAFLQAVLLPESAQRWARYMKAPPQELPADEGDPRRDPVSGMRPATEAEQAQHRQHMISLRQCMGVYQELMKVYSGRPTVPPSSSGNGHGGTGGTSTAGAPAEVSTP